MCLLLAQKFLPPEEDSTIFTKLNPQLNCAYRF